MKKKLFAIIGGVLGVIIVGVLAISLLGGTSLPKLTGTYASEEITLTFDENGNFSAESGDVKAEGTFELGDVGDGRQIIALTILGDCPKEFEGINSDWDYPKSFELITSETEEYLIIDGTNYYKK